jgi:aromatic-L-amino-acid/L-tryptophan decarboxylase
VTEADRRTTTLDLPDGELRALFEGASRLAEREIVAARDGPVFAEPPSAGRIAALLGDPEGLPYEGQSVDALLESCAALLAEGRRTAPGFFGYVQSPPAPVAVAADLLVSAADQNVTAWRSAPAATQVEQLVIAWLSRLVGFADHPAGLMTSGGSASNLMALLIALHARADGDADRRRLSVYTSEEAHFSVAKAAAVLGVRMRAVAADRRRRLSLPALERAIRDDRRAGLEPFCVVGSAGTTATGAIDPLDALAELSAAEGLWHHVDGAYGALAAADADLRPSFAGLERADSLCLDLHKWLYAPVDCGALLVREPGASANAFGARAGEYVRVIGGGEIESFAFWDHGLELSRRFRALKVWMTLRLYGTRRLAAAIAEDVAVAAHLGSSVRAADELELLSGPELSICCFRHVPAGMPGSELDAHNERLLAALQQDGRVYLSNAQLDGCMALRACVTNFRTTRLDVERAVAVVEQIGAALARR